MIQPKYQIGQTVYKGGGHYGEDWIECPDCRGKLCWSVTTPAGETFDIPCHTCERGYEGCRGRVQRHRYKPYVMVMTIGSIRVNTNDEKPISYMCIETGVGSGSIHYEESLFLTQEEAERFGTQEAERMAAERDAHHKSIEAHNKKKSRRKPEWWEQRIKHLEAQLAAKVPA